MIALNVRTFAFALVSLAPGVLAAQEVVPLAGQNWVVFSDDSIAFPGQAAAIPGGIAVIDVEGHTMVVARVNSGGRSRQKGEPRLVLIAPSSLTVDSTGHIYLWDRGAQSLLETDPAGAIRKETHLEAGILDYTPWFVLRTPRGLYAVLNQAMSYGARSLRRSQRPAVFARAGGDPGGWQDTLATLPAFGVVTWIDTVPGPPARIRTRFVSNPWPAMPHPTWTPACGGLLALATGGRDFAISVFRDDGSTLARIELPVLGAILSDQAVENGLAPLDSVSRVRVLDLLPAPPRYPAVRDLLLTSNGQLWVKTGDDGQRGMWFRWLLDAAADSGRDAVRQLETVAVPGSIRPVDIRADTLWALQRTSHGAWRPVYSALSGRFGASCAQGGR